MNPEIFRYNSIISIPLIGLISLLLLRGLKQEKKNYANETISFLSTYFSPLRKRIFNTALLCKGALDLSFTYFVFDKLSVDWFSPLAFIWLVPVVAFGLEGFFPYYRFPQLHEILGYVTFLGWLITQPVFAHFIGTTSFVYLTYLIVIVQISIILFFFLRSKINAFFELLYAGTLLVWIVLLLLYL